MLKKILFSLVMLALAPSAFADVRWYNPKYDSLDTLRVCFRVAEINKDAYGSYRATLNYTGAETGVDKLDRKGAYPTVKDVEYQYTSYPNGEDVFSYAFLNRIYVCEISWDLGLHWVVSKEEVSGDR